MVDFTFNGLFRTTSKGLPDLTNLPPNTSISLTFFIFSVILQVIILFIFISYFALSVYRVVKKIKNKKFSQVEEEEQNEEKELAKDKTHEEHLDEEEIVSKKPKKENLIYKFDEDQEEEKVVHEEVGEEKEEDFNKPEEIQSNKNEEEESAEDYNSYHDDNEEAFIDLDQKLLFIQPFLIGFVICNNLFAANALTIVFVVLTLLCYFLFNIKLILERIKVMSMVFMLPAMLGFLSFYISDHDLTT